MKNSFKNTFPLDEKYLSLAGVFEKWKKLTSTSKKISFHEQKVATPQFNIYNRALNKAILFLLDRIFVSTSRNEKFVKKTFPLGETVFTAWNI